MFSISYYKIRLVSLEINKKHGRGYEKKKETGGKGGGRGEKAERAKEKNRREGDGKDRGETL